MTSIIEERVDKRFLPKAEKDYMIGNKLNMVSPEVEQYVFNSYRFVTPINDNLPSDEEYRHLLIESGASLEFATRFVDRLNKPGDYEDFST